MLEYHNVGMTYKGSVADVEALSDLNMGVDKGQPIALIGPSGCGKSTALLLATGLLQPTSGSVTVAGVAAHKPRLETALILQDFGLLPWKTAYQNAELGLKVRHFSKAERRERTNQALDQVGLLDFARSYPSELSGGMRQRLALARVLALDVDLLLMDEPLSSLDALLREGLQDSLLKLWRVRAYTQVLVTHSIEEAVFLGKRIVVLCPRPGQVVAIIDNPEMGELDYRQNPLFYQRCHEVREA
jgi:NitT/TauT family transport system ATP-binding protein